MPILIAVNPYKMLPVYSDDSMKHYKNFFERLKRDPNSVEAPIPHVYHIAEAAYQDMIMEKKNQSIIIAGESGSGKTQSTKIILKYLAVSSMHSSALQQKSEEKSVTVEKQVLDSNPLLEAFGNAKTVKNNNSSRFGKFIQVNFTDHGKIISAKIYNYLLEKSRVVKIQPEERNYHIFYQLIKGADDKERSKHYIKPVEHFDFLNQGCFDVEDVDDAADFREMKDCMLKLKFKPEEMAYIFNVVMGILYLGNVQFIEEESGGNPISVVDPDCSEDFKLAAELLGVDEKTLGTVLTIRKMKDPMSKNVFDRNLPIDKAYNCRDAICKAVYAKMFDFIVKRVNNAISNSEELNKHDKEKIKKIGLLDIFGFENFEINSFEQLCINYANERLQQYFNNHIFKLEQEEYKKEGIDWSQVEFIDNKDIIDLIDDPKLSIFNFLDSEGITPNSNDFSFKDKVYHHLSNNGSLGDNEEDHISIYHYAGLVFYYVEGFIEKNLDQLTPDILGALGKSKNKLIKKVFEIKEDGKKPKKGSSAPNKLQSDSLSKQFKRQLDELLKMLSQSNPRYVKCIKPNSQKKSQILESNDVMDQLLSAGVLEAIKIRKQGYSIRRTKEEFVRRYHPLTPQIDLKYHEHKNDFAEALEEMLKMLNQVPEIHEYSKPEKKLLQIGHTKVFMKEEVKNVLEFKLNRIKYINRIQSKFRGWKVQKRVWKVLKAVRKIQAHWRGVVMRLLVRHMLKSVKSIQVSVKFWLKKLIILRNLKKLAMENIERKEKERAILERKRESEKQKEQAAPQNNNFNSENTNAISTNSFEENASMKEKKKERKPSSSNRIGRLERQSNVSIKESVGDVSTSDVQLMNDLKKIMKKGGGKKQKLNYADLLNTNVDVDNEIRNTVEILTKDLEKANTEKETLAGELSQYKDELKRRDKVIEELKKNNETKVFQSQIDNYTSNLDKIGNDLSITKKSFNNMNAEVPKCDHEDEIKKLKSQIADKEGNMDILNLRVDEITKSNKDLSEMNESLKDQLQKRKEKMNKEMTDLFNQINDMEKKNKEVTRQNKSLIEEKDKLKQKSEEESESLNKSLRRQETRALNELKTENKQLNKRIEELQSKNEKDINALKQSIVERDQEIAGLQESLEKVELEYKQKEEEYSNMKVEYDLCKDKIQDMKEKLELLHKNSRLEEYEHEINEMKHEFETNVKKKDNELKELKETLESTYTQVERLKRMEKALKNELASKDDDLSRRQTMLRDAREENDKLCDENMDLKRHNFNLKSKLENLQSEANGSNESEFKQKIQELEELKEKVKKYEKIIAELRDSLLKKKRILDSKKKMNVLLVDLAKLKKGEVQCLETLQYTKSSNLKDTLVKIRQNENELLSQLGQVSANPDYTDSEGEEEDSEGSEFEYEDN